MEFFEEKVNINEIKKKLLDELYDTFQEYGISKVTMIEDFATYQEYSKNIIVAALKELVAEGSAAAWPLCSGYNITPDGIKTVENSRNKG